MALADTLTRDSGGQLLLGGVPLGELAERYGTPLYVMDVATLRHRLETWKAALGPDGLLFYAGKAFLCRAMAELLAQHGVGLDVVSGGELLTALAAGLPARHIAFHGNLKSERELRLALAAGVGRIVADSRDELAMLSRLALEAGSPATVWIRLTPGVEAHTHRYIVTGHNESKFGFAIEGGEADRAVALAMELPGLALTGYHWHIGSQILELEPFRVAVDRVMAFAAEQYERRGLWPEVVDIGGGLGIAEGDGAAPTPAALLEIVRERVHRGTPAGLPVPRVAAEPGRSVAAEAGLTIYRVGAVKESGGHRVYVVVDGGMGDNIRPALYRARYHAEPVVRRSGGASTVTVAGRYCESGDIVIEDERLPRVEPGDLVAVLNTGAYNYVMASAYNRVPPPPVVAVEDGRAAVWVERADWDQVADFDRPLGAAGL
jgi:diaminopimelate decarboxylase